MRIVVLSSKGHYMHRGSMAFHDLHYQRRRYNKLASYAQSKLANVLFASQLARCRKGIVSAYSQQGARAQCYALSLCLFCKQASHIEQAPKHRRLLLVRAEEPNQL